MGAIGVQPRGVEPVERAVGLARDPVLGKVSFASAQPHRTLKGSKGCRILLVVWSRVSSLRQAGSWQVPGLSLEIWTGGGLVLGLGGRWRRCPWREGVV